MNIIKRIKTDSTFRKMIIFSTLTAILLLVMIFAEQVVPYDPYEQDLSSALQPPNAAHWLGTDRYGRDMLSRVIVGGRTTITSSLLLVLIIMSVGTAVGVICGYYGGWAGTTLMRVSDVFLAFPGMVFAIAIASAWGGGVGNAVAALACVSWPKYARLARSQVLIVRESAYINAAKLSGQSAAGIIFRHIIPNIAGSVLVTAVLDIGTMMMEIAGLSFLGLGAVPPAAEWGSMMSNGRSMLQTCPWVILAPGCAIFLTVSLFNLLGDTVRDVLDPRNRKNK